ncbi:MAG: hypothetical protein Q8P66_00735 [Candidatus Colwellbacteria bacterium]|nr:hypothetical protein [Candidatus Colwellbacteria bacterium]
MEDYLERLKERGKTSRVYREYQLVGLMVAEVLGDEKHKSLYIKLARKHGSERMLQLAKSVAERKEVRNKGAYFMKMLEIEKGEKSDNR